MEGSIQTARRRRHVPQTSARGTYLQISAELRQKIKAHEIAEALPSEASLMKAHGVARGTVGRALRALRDEGLIESVPGAGWYVAGTADRRPLVERLTELLATKSIGDRFPSEAELCEMFGVSRIAVRRALAHLEGNGLLATVHGKGRTIRALPAEPSKPDHGGSLD